MSNVEKIKNNYGNNYLQFDNFFKTKIVTFNTTAAEQPVGRGMSRVCESFNRQVLVPRYGIGRVIILILRHFRGIGFPPPKKRVFLTYFGF